MFRYVIIVLLVNCYNCGLGSPVPAPQTNGTTVQLGKLLADLANNQCNNTFLKNQIKSKIEECNINVPPYSLNAIKCILFYDVNSLLCSADHIKHIEFEDHIGDKINNDKVKITDICKDALLWNFTDLKEVNSYKNLSENIFRNFSYCSKACMISDFLDDASFFCKYYSWGLKMFKAVGKEDIKSELSVEVPKDVPIVIVPQFGEPLPENQSSIVGTKASGQEGPSGGFAQLPNPSAEEKSNTIQVKDDHMPSQKSTEPAEDKNDNKIIPKDSQADTGLEQAEIVPKPPTSQEKPVGSPPQTQPKVPSKEAKETAIEQPKPKSVINETDLEDESDADVDVDDGQDGGDTFNMDLDDQQNKLPKVIHNEKIEPPTGEFGQRGNMIHETIQDNFPQEEEDHFFSFFLSAVVLVILLYVLYHNKSKVTKVVLGLIVEGRQSGRRRNSRGHSYRRLDTLEQAISTTPTAAPTKIIY